MVKPRLVKKRNLATVLMGAAVIILPGCQGIGDISETAATYSASTSAVAASAMPKIASALPPSPSPNFSSVRPLAPAEPADVTGLTADQIEAMFDAAAAQAGPGKDTNAICVGMQGRDDRWTRDPPPMAVTYLSKKLGLPAVAASKCGSDLAPFLIQTRQKAILYTVKVEARDPPGTLTFWATAVYGNLGANGMQYRLQRRGDRWVPQFTGLSVVS